MNEIKIKINGKEYPLAFTIAATKEITEKFGGIGNVYEEMKKSTNMDTILWLVALLANQRIMQNNLLSDTKEKPITAEFIEYFATPAELAEYAVAIKDVMVRDSKRHVESEDEQPKN